MAGFLQIVEIKTSNIDAVRALLDDVLDVWER